MGFRNASLILKSSDITPTVNNTNFVWRNINLRTVLGDMYDQYDQFNLCLNAITTSQANNTLGTALDDINVLVNVQGFPWVNNSYSYASQHNTGTAVISSFNFVRNACATQVFYSNNVLTFSKNQDNLDITIYYTRVIDSAVPSTAQAFPVVNFLFTIQGIERSEVHNGYNPSRLIK